MDTINQVKFTRLIEEGRKTKIKGDKPLVNFFILSFILAWMFMSIGVVQNYGLVRFPIPLEPFIILGSWTPNIAAFLVMGLIIRRKDGIKHLILGWAKWKVSPLWYLVSLSPVLLSLITLGIYRVLYGVFPTTELFSNPALLLPLLLINILTGATGEQLGWRGFALPWFQTKMSALLSSIVLGLIWSFWHIPLWFAGIGHESFPFWAYSIIGVSFSILVTWACNNTRGSMLIASLFHLFLNLGVSMINPIATPLLAVVFALYALIIVMIFGPRKLSRKNEIPINKDKKSWVIEEKG